MSSTFKTVIINILLLLNLFSIIQPASIPDLDPRIVDRNPTTKSNSNSKSNKINYDEIDFSLDPSKYNYPYPCPGLEVGFECDYTSSWSSRNGDHFFCDIEVIPLKEMTRDRFMNDYLFKKPVVIDANLSDWSDVEFWGKKHWLQHYGDYPFEVGRSLPIVLNSGIGTHNITLSEYFADTMRPGYCEDDMGPYDAEFLEPMYVFDRSIWRDEHEFQLKHFRGPDYFFNSMEEQYGILFIGVTGTGATWHAHGENWAGLGYGRKRWFVYPPEVQPPGGFWPAYSTKAWFENIYDHLDDDLTHIKDPNDWNNHFTENSVDDKQYSTNDPNNFGNLNFLRSNILQRSISDDEYMSLNSDSSIEDILKADHKYNHNGLHKPLECIQQPGQIIYLPEYWWHAVLNIGTITGAGIQTSQGYIAYNTEINEMGALERLLKDKQQKKKHRRLMTDLEKSAISYDMLLVHDRLGKHAPFNAVHQFFVGHEYKNLNEAYLAEQYFEEAALMDPSMIEAYIGLARIYKQSNRLWHNYLAERYMRLAYVLNDNHPNVRELLMDLFEEQGDDDLVKLVLQHKALPPVREYTEEELNQQQEEDEIRTNRYSRGDYYYGDYDENDQLPKTKRVQLQKFDNIEDEYSTLADDTYNKYENPEPIEYFDDQ